MKSGIFFALILSSAISFSLNAQKAGRKITISGYVTDAMHNPVPGSMILIDTKNSGKTTDEKGFYKIRVSADASKITVFTILTGSAESLIEGRTTINLTLDGSSPVNEDPGAENPGDEVVNIGYGAARDKNLSIPVNRIDASGNQYGAYSDIYDMLNGTVPGVQVSGKKIVIRGVATNSSNTDPLFLVNGITVPSLDNIPPNMVESIQVLKGAAASIYGLQGANGVIMINLKK